MLLKNNKPSVNALDLQGLSRSTQMIDQSRLDNLVKLVDHCTSAKEIAEILGDTFLAYMLGMSIQAARAEMRPKILRARR